MHELLTLNKATILDAALHYHALGWRVIPLIDKRPVTPWTTEPRYTTNIIRTIFEDQSHFNLGVIMGKESNLIALDIDGEAGRIALQAASNRTDEIDEVYSSLIFTTPNKGLRFLYEYTPELKSRSLRYNGKEAVRIMTDGTQTVMPPSALDGNPYQWTQTEDKLRKAPIEFIRKLIAAEKSLVSAPPVPSDCVSVHDAYNRARRYVQACEPAITGQLGGTRTFKICCRIVHGFGLNYHQAMNIMMENFNPRCQPEWTEEEMTRKVEQALQSTKPSPSLL